MAYDRIGLFLDVLIAFGYAPHRDSIGPDSPLARGQILNEDRAVNLLQRLDLCDSYIDQQ